MALFIAVSTSANMDRLRDFGFLLKDVTRRYVLRFEQRARDLSLTLPQCKTLVRLEKNEGVSQARLAELADVDAMTMVRILDRMEADGLLERRADPGDRRARRLYLTAKAKPLLDEIWRLAEATRAETFAGISQPDRETFIALLERMHRNICDLDTSPAEARPQQAAAQIAAHPNNGATRPRKIRTRS
jgi:MarR family transcriptional regulator, transcriptional regulator for hemolysin